MTNFTLSPEDVRRFREEHPEQASQICQKWKEIKPILVVIKGLPFVPKEVKDAIDWIIKFGDLLCP